MIRPVINPEYNTTINSFSSVRVGRSQWSSFYRGYLKSIERRHNHHINHKWRLIRQLKQPRGWWVVSLQGIVACAADRVGKNWWLLSPPTYTRKRRSYWVELRRSVSWCSSVESFAFIHVPWQQHRQVPRHRGVDSCGHNVGLLIPPNEATK